MAGPGIVRAGVQPRLGVAERPRVGTQETSPPPSETGAKPAPSFAQARELAAVGVAAHSADAVRASDAQGRVLEGARKALDEIAAKVESSGGKLDRTATARLTSRLRQVAATLERVDPRHLDDASRAAIERCASLLEGSGGLFDLKALAGKLRGLLGGTSKVEAVTAAAPKKTVDALRAHIHQARDAYARGDYATAQKLLTDGRFAESLGLQLNVNGAMLRSDPTTWPKEDLDALVVELRMKSMSWGTGKIDICTADHVDFSNGEMRGKRLHEMPALAKRLLPIMMEEWMHQLQRLSGQPCSKLGAEFVRAQGSEWSATWHEMDIQASFREWRFPVEQLGTVEAYPERRAFEAWYQGRR